MIGLADSVTDANPKLKAGAVEIEGIIHRDLLLSGAKDPITIRLGKKWARVRIRPPPVTDPLRSEPR